MKGLKGSLINTVGLKSESPGGPPGHVEILLYEGELVLHAPAHHHHLLRHLWLHHHWWRWWTHWTSHRRHALHSAGLLEPSVPHLDLTEEVGGVGLSVGHGSHHGHHGGVLGGHHAGNGRLHRGGLHHGHLLHGLGSRQSPVPGTQGLVLRVPLGPHGLQGGVALQPGVVAERLQRERRLECVFWSPVISQVLVGSDSLDHFTTGQLDVGHPLVVDGNSGRLLDEDYCCY